MKYVILDTNIFLEMVVDRNNKISGVLLELFIKLLNYHEIKLVVPKIVKVETYRHLDDELEKVGKNIQAVIKDIKSLYGINAYTIDGLDIQDYKKESSKQLVAAKEMFKKNKITYQKELTEIMEMLFSHDSCILIEDDEFLDNAVLKRRIYKRAPFHIEVKESYADGLIAETLIHLKRYISIEADDEIIFVTRNYKDFSRGNDKRDELHPDIINDLRKEGIENITYIGEFGILIQGILKENVANANLAEEFEKEIEAEEAQQKEEYWSDYEDLTRESVGLSSLGNFESNFEDAFSDSHFQYQFTSLLVKLSGEYGKLEESSVFYSENLYDYVRSQKYDQIPGILKGANEFCTCLEDPENPEYTIDDVESFLLWIDKQNQLVNHELWEIQQIDTIDFGDEIYLYKPTRERVKFQLDELYISPSNGSADQIDMKILDEKGEILVRGNIGITYGFVEENEDGGIGDGCDESIDYNVEEILEFLQELITEWKTFNKQQLDTIKGLSDKFSL